ncbi:glycosyl transferase family 4 [Candidatus Pacearchaeota archaeon]|nr:glycosyl transferase family 4 [Candidatus Pacearchaeota archaeon]
MNALLLIPIIASFFVTFFMIPRWIKKAKQIGLLWEDMNKYKKEKVAGSGGIIVILGFIFSVFIYISIKTFYFNSSENVVEILATTTSMLLLLITGLVDDLLGWWHGGLSKRTRILLCLFASIPLVVINVGSSHINLPFLDGTNLGLIYPLIIIPIGIIGASTTFNFLAGYNGLEASQGILIISALSIVAYFTGHSWLALIGICLIFSLAAFFIFNKYPAKVFPGDTLTYPIGGMIAIMAILGDMEKIAIFFFIPYIIELVLKARGRLKKQSFGKPNKDNSLELAYNKMYGLEHVAIFLLKKIKKKVYEKDVVAAINIFQIIIIILGFLIFKNSIF